MIELKRFAREFRAATALVKSAPVVVLFCAGPRRIRSQAVVELKKGENNLTVSVPLQCHATLFKPKTAGQGNSSLPNNRQKPDVLGAEENPSSSAATAAAKEDCFLNKEARIQVSICGFSILPCAPLALLEFSLTPQHLFLA